MKKYSLNERNRLNDHFIKFLFTEDDHKNLILSFINSVLELEGTEKLEYFEFINKELNSHNKKDKWCRLDVLGKSSNGTRVNVEVQIKKYKDMALRSLFYWARIFRRLARNQKYGNLKKCICINLLDFNLIEDCKSPDYHNCYKIINTKRHSDILTDILELHFVEMPKWELERPKTKEINRISKWLTFFSNKTTDEERSNLKEDEMISQAMALEDKYFSDPEMITAYEQAEKDEMDAAAREDQVRDEKAEEIVGNLLKEKIPVSTIARASGLSETRVNAIKSSLKL